MKKLSILFALFLMLNCNVYAHGHYHAHYNSCSNCVYIVGSDTFQEEKSLTGTNNYYLLVNTTVNYYSNGTKRTYYDYTILKKDGTVLFSDCDDVEYISYNKKDYFLVKSGRYYKILQSNSNLSAKRQYSKMKKLSSNKILVCVNKKYGVIDINENIIVPIKYKEFEQIGNDLYKTKLNGYYGLKNSSNYAYLKDEYDSIKPFYDTFLIKKEGKYGLVDIKGKMIIDATYDKIVKKDEYIVAKKDKLYEIFNSSGEKITNEKYRKIKLERNQLKVLKDNSWDEL